MVTPAIANLQNFTLIGTKTALPKPPLSRGSSAPPAIVPAADEELDDTLSSTDLKEAIKDGRVPLLVAETEREEGGGDKEVTRSRASCLQSSDLRNKHNF